MGDALSTGVGQAVCFAAASVFSFFVPRVLGAGVYGEWMLYRGLGIFWLTLLLLGDRLVMSAFYLPCRERGEVDAAARVYSFLVALRMGLSIPFVVCMLGMWYRAGGMFHSASDGLWLAVTFVARGTYLNMNTLMFGHRRMGRLAALEGMQSVVLPLAVLGACRSGRPEWIPAAAAGTDMLQAALASCGATWRREWHWRWPSAIIRRAMVRYILLVGMASTVTGALNQLLFYLMGCRGYAPETIGRVALAMRCVWIAQTGLMALGAALLPALAGIRQQDGEARMVRWRNLVMRFGVALLLLLAGNLLWAGPRVAALIWGDEFRNIMPLIAAGLVATAGVWVAAQWSVPALLRQDGRVQLHATLAYAVMLCGGLWAMPVDASGWGALVAVGVASLAMAVVAWGWARRDEEFAGRWVGRFVWPCALAIPLMWGVGRGGWGVWLVGFAVWNGLFTGALLLCGAIHWFEVRDLWSMFWMRRRNVVA